jgi:hypothetical protein
MFQQSLSGLVTMRLSLAGKVEGCASRCITEVRVGTILQEKLDDVFNVLRMIRFVWK